MTQISAQKAKFLENEAVSGKIAALKVEARYAFHRVEHSNPGRGALKRAEKSVKVQKKVRFSCHGPAPPARNFQNFSILEITAKSYFCATTW